MQENYENEGMAADTVARLNDNFSKMQQFLKDKAEPTIDLFKFTFAGPENPKADKIIPLGRRKNKVNAIGENHADAKWLTTLNRIDLLGKCVKNLKQVR